ncbi:hypothetical protein AAFF_G00104780 [Aldrovandia affinis]|uniref:Uncharacterized protein n=1 Tax=Aldrovandia affinis TaxID=143900 RepID=A0AAD7T3R5_9TELE|nr:hypothetical protein AAFF_G00104780 [Aldrovandia affinis]
MTHSLGLQRRLRSQSCGCAAGAHSRVRERIRVLQGPGTPLQNIRDKDKPPRVEITSRQTSPGKGAKLVHNLKAPPLLTPLSAAAAAVVCKAGLRTDLRCAPPPAGPSER